MQQPLPLPERIPRPNVESEQGKNLVEALKKAGIVLEEGSEWYARYTIPSGWTMIDDSLREDVPQFYLLDEKNLIHFSISGTWKETYDNELYLTQVTPPRIFKSQRQSDLSLSETSLPTISRKKSFHSFSGKKSLHSCQAAIRLCTGDVFQ